MALLLVRVPEEGTLLLNEYFDYDGFVYASAVKHSTGSVAEMALEDFYEATVRTGSLKDIPVIFVLEKEDGWMIAGWYGRAEIFRKSEVLSLFLEGNIRAKSSEAVLLPESERNRPVTALFGQKLYEVVESDDERYAPLVQYIRQYGGNNAFIRYDNVDISIPGGAKQDKEAIRQTCEAIAQDLMTDGCRDISDIKRLEIYARRLSILDSGSADGCYYEAMALHQLGKVKEGLKAIGKALRKEEAGDLLAMKANLLISMKHIPEAAELYHQAWLAEGDEDYLLLEGRAWMLVGQMEKAYHIFKKVSDEAALREAGINLKDMERKWPFVNVRGLNLKGITGGLPWKKKV